jgi:hypothetical protein
VVKLRLRFLIAFSPSAAALATARHLMGLK